MDHRGSGFRGVMWLAAAALSNGCIGLVDVEFEDTDESRRIRGSGVVVSENRSVSGFDGLQIRGEGRLIVTHGSDEQLTIRADDNLMRHITSHVSRQGDLILGPPNGVEFDVRGALEYQLTVTSLNRIRISGVVNGEVSGVRSADLEVDVSGVSTLDISGAVRTQSVSISGVSTYGARGLESEMAHLEISGVFGVVVQVSAELTGSACGVGGVTVHGGPDIDFQRCVAVGFTVHPGH